MEFSSFLSFWNTSWLALWLKDGQGLRYTTIMATRLLFDPSKQEIPRKKGRRKKEHQRMKSLEKRMATIYTPSLEAHIGLTYTLTPNKKRNKE